MAITNELVNGAATWISVAFDAVAAFGPFRARTHELVSSRNRGSRHQRGGT